MSVSQTTHWWGKKQNKTGYQKQLEWYGPLCTETSISFLHTPAVYLSKAFNMLLAPLPHCQPPSLVEPIHNCRPPIAVCQMPASDIVHHCAGVSRANCHLFFSCAPHEGRQWRAQKHTWGGKIWPKPSAGAGNHEGMHMLEGMLH